MALLASHSRHRMSTRSVGARLGWLGLELALPVVLIATWWVASSGSTSLYFPPLSAIMSSFVDVWLFSHFASDFLPSVEHLGEGFLLATVLGVLVGLILGLAPVIADAVAPVLEFLRALPGVALVPAVLLLLGIGAKMQVVVIVSATVWPILLNTVDGVRGIDPVVNDVARAYRIRFSDRLLRMVIRSASPQIVAGMRTALSIGIIMIVFSELVGSTNGIGFQLLQAQRSFAISEMWASMILFGLLGYLLTSPSADSNVSSWDGTAACAKHWTRGNT